MRNFNLKERLELSEIPYSVILAEDGDPVFQLKGTGARFWETSYGSYKLYEGPEINQSFESIEDLIAALKKLLGHG